MLPRILLAPALAGCLLVPTAFAQDLVPEEGQPFPDLVFTTLDGESASLADFRGEKVLLLQFASW